MDDVSPETLGAALGDALSRSWNRETIVDHASRFSWDAAAEAGGRNEAQRRGHLREWKLDHELTQELAHRGDELDYQG